MTEMQLNPPKYNSVLRNKDLRVIYNQTAIVNNTMMNMQMLNTLQKTSLEHQLELIRQSVEEFKQTNRFVYIKVKDTEAMNTIDSTLQELQKRLQTMKAVKCVQSRLRRYLTQL